MDKVNKKKIKEELNQKAERMLVLKERDKLVLDAWMYGIKRIDILIISICGAGIYLCMTGMQFLIEHPDLLYTKQPFKWSCSWFSFAIITNFISHAISVWVQRNDYNANLNEMNRLEKEIKFLRNKVDSNSDKKEKENLVQEIIELQNTIDKSAKTGTKVEYVRTGFEYTSYCFMLIGILVLGIYFHSTF